MSKGPESFPFGMPIEPLAQADRSHKVVFVLGVYASAVHARWLDQRGRTLITALAVASEPEIFWRGVDAATIVAGISVPPRAGRLEPASPKLNGPSGRALDEHFLHPLGIGRGNAWLCDLLPLSRQNKRQAAALAREYLPRMKDLGLPGYNWPFVPPVLASDERRREIEIELSEAAASVLITLGDQPLRWFTRFFGSKSRLAAYGQSQDAYGRLHDIDVAGRKMSLLPLVHPRQAGGLGMHSSRWSQLHQHWVRNVAPALLDM